MQKSTIKTDWQKGGFVSPTVNYAVSSTGESFLVIEDDSTIFKLVNKEGHIYMIAGFRCQKTASPQFLNSMPFYTIKDNILHPILCSKLESPKDQYAVSRMIKTHL